MIEPYVETRSGRKVHFLDPQPDELDIEDIAWALAQQCRFNGHCSQFYSVAEHSVAVSRILPKHLRLAGLMHDASEAYLSDIPSPVKQFLPDYFKIEQTVMDAIIRKFNLVGMNNPPIKHADLQQLRTEAFYLLPSRGDNWAMWDEWKPDVKHGFKPVGYDPDTACKRFMETFEYLTEDARTAA